MYRSTRAITASHLRLTPIVISRSFATSKPWSTTSAGDTTSTVSHANSSTQQSKPASKSDDVRHSGSIDHLENPTAAEEVVHAERLDVDPLAEIKKKKRKEESHAVDGHKKENASGKRGFSTSARSLFPQGKQEDKSHMHRKETDIDHLEKPTITEEEIHADRLEEDPLKDMKKLEAERVFAEGKKNGKNKHDGK